jgi:hypothetical protein
MVLYFGIFPNTILITMEPSVNATLTRYQALVVHDQAAMPKVGALQTMPDGRGDEAVTPTPPADTKTNKDTKHDSYND